MPEVYEEMGMTNEQCKRYEIYVKLDTLQMVKENTTDEKTKTEIDRLIKELRKRLETV